MTEADDGTEWAVSEWKDWKDGRHRRRNEYVGDHVGEVADGSARRTITMLEGAFRRAHKRGWLSGDWPAALEDTDLYRILRRYHDSEAAGRRIENGDFARLRAHVGSQRDEVDVSNWRDIERIREVVTERHLRLYLYGEPGTGKTRSGCLVARHWLEERREQGQDDAVILTNIRTLASQVEAAIYVRNWPELKEQMDAEMDDILDEAVRPFLFLFDEASSQASGNGKDGYEASTKLATLVYKIRKYGGALAIIGHDGKDLHPAVRELCKVLHKEDTKVARFYESIKNRQGVAPITPTITGWPDSMWSPNDKDPAPWAWSAASSDGDGEDAEDITAESVFRDLAIWTVVQVKTSNETKDLGFEKIAEKHLYGAYSGEWCRRRWNEYDEGDHAETVAEIQEAIA